MSVTRWALALSLTAACAVSRPLAYEQRLAAGDRAFSSGRYAEAAAAYASAAETGGRVRDQDQARTLAGERAGAGLADAGAGAGDHHAGVLEVRHVVVLSFQVSR